MRRASQLLFLALFLFLFRMTDYHGRDELGYAVNIFFRWDPLAAAAAMLAARALIALFVPALAVIALTAVLGRSFCGWVCPLGTCLDAAHLAITPRPSVPRSRRAYKYYVLIIVLVAALPGLPLAGWVDPFSILVRGLAVAADPGLKAAVSWPFDYAYQHGPNWLTALTEPVFAAMKSTVLPYAQKGFLHGPVSIIILAAVFALERIERRFWCRNLCPLGALLALPARVAPLKMHPGRACRTNGCSTCIDLCRMGAIDAEGNVSPEACNLCMECMDRCDKGIISFRFKRPKAAPAPIGISRRDVAAAIAAGAVMPVLLNPRGRAAKYARGSGLQPEALIRPPGAQDEAAFVGRCVRCGECMKVCINNALHPALTEAGLAGVFTPMLVPRLGGCEFNCTLCGQVCPSGAIPRLAKPEKQKTVIGLAWFDRNRCRPWADLVACSVCEEMCPLPDKAIKLREEQAVNMKGETVTIKRPYLVAELCIGCGICENKCPLPGPAAVRVGGAEGEAEGTG